MNDVTVRQLDTFCKTFIGYSFCHHCKESAPKSFFVKAYGNNSTTYDNDVVGGDNSERSNSCKNTAV